MPPEVPPVRIDPDLCAQIVEGLQQAYESACDHYDESQGSKEATFGFDLYHKCGFQLSQLEQRSNGRIRELAEHPAWRHQIDDYTVVCHRVARTAEADIYESFPDSEGAAAMSTPFLPGFEPDVTQITNLVIAHVGNHQEGLLAVYLCAPVTNGDGKMQWGFAHPIYIRGTNTRATPPSAPPTAPPPPPEEVAAPQLTRRRRADEDPSDRG